MNVTNPDSIVNVEQLGYFKTRLIEEISPQYVAGSGINISNKTISLLTATGNAIGGVKVLPNNSTNTKGIVIENDGTIGVRVDLDTEYEPDYITIYGKANSGDIIGGMLCDIDVANTTYAGVMSATQASKLAGIADGATKVSISGSSSDGYTLSNGTTSIGTSSTPIAYAANAIKASSASYATSAGSATSADSASYATTAGSATSATNATNATNAENASYATSAGSATKATQDGNGSNIASTYVKKDGSKVLSDNNYTTSEKNKLSGITESATKTSISGSSSDGYTLSNTSGSSTASIGTSSTPIAYSINATNAQNASYATSAGSASSASSASYATSAGSATSASSATYDGSGNNIASTYVKKDGSKVLSDNNYTTSEKNKLSGIASGADKTTISAHSSGGYYLSNGTTSIGNSNTPIAYAVTATNALNASYATNAGSASSATSASSASYATSAGSASSATYDGSGNNIASTYVKATDTKDLTFSGTLNVDNDTSITLKSPIMMLDGEVNVPEYLYVLEDWLMVLPAEGGGTLSLALAYLKKSDDIVYATNAGYATSAGSASSATSAETATKATRATADASGNNIANTYMRRDVIDGDYAITWYSGKLMVNVDDHTIEIRNGMLSVCDWLVQAVSNLKSATKSAVNNITVGNGLCIDETGKLSLSTATNEDIYALFE